MSPIPQAYVACLASYNNGILHGDWIALDGSENINRRIKEILRSSPISKAEEYAIHDHEHCGNLGEYDGRGALIRIATAYQATQQEGIEWKAFAAYCDHLSEEISTEAIQHFQESYAGASSSIEGWCEEFLEDSGQLSEIPENLRYYFNFESLARDMQINDVFTVAHNSQTLVFWRR